MSTFIPVSSSLSLTQSSSIQEGEQQQDVLNGEDLQFSQEQQSLITTANVPASLTEVYTGSAPQLEEPSQLMSSQDIAELSLLAQNPLVLTPPLVLPSQSKQQSLPGSTATYSSEESIASLRKNLESVSESNNLFSIDTMEVKTAEEQSVEGKGMLNRNPESVFDLKKSMTTLSGLTRKPHPQALGHI